jgi:hypothetical protein
VPLGETAGQRIGLVAHGGKPLGELELVDAAIFVVGAEREGLPEEVLARCDVGGDDSDCGAGGIAQRRRGGSDRALRMEPPPL